MKDYINFKRDLIANTNRNITIIVPDLLLPEINDSKGNIIFKKSLVSKLNPVNPLKFQNEIITGELHLEELNKISARRFEIKISNRGSSPCYNAKCVLYKQESGVLVKKNVIDKFTIGIDEKKMLYIDLNEDIVGVYYAVVHDPIMDSFPFANIDNLIKNQLPDPSLANSGWSAYTPIGNSIVSNQYWIFEMIPLFADLIGNANAFINSVKKPNNNSSSELKYTVAIPEFLKSSVKKDKISIRFGATCLSAGLWITSHSSNPASIKLNILNNPKTFPLKSENRLSTIRLGNFQNGYKNVCMNNLPTNTNEINFFLQSKQLPREIINFSLVNLHFEHRQMKQYPEILKT